MRFRSLAAFSASLVILAGCSTGPSADEKASAVDYALNYMGDCMNIGGYDVDRAGMIDSAGPGPQSGYVLVYFFSENGGDAVRVAVNPGDKSVAPLDNGDLKRIRTAGC